MTNIRRHASLVVPSKLVELPRPRQNRRPRPGFAPRLRWTVLVALALLVRVAFAPEL